MHSSAVAGRVAALGARAHGLGARRDPATGKRPISTCINGQIRSAAVSSPGAPTGRPQSVHTLRAEAWVSVDTEGSAKTNGRSVVQRGRRGREGAAWARSMPLHVHGMNQGTKRQDKKEHKIKIKVIEKMGKKRTKIVRANK